MPQSITTFFSEMKEKKIALIGMGVTNFNVIRWFLQKGLDVTVCDKREPDEIGERFDQLKKLGAKFITGPNYLSKLEQFQVVLRSPGVYFYRDELQKAREAGVVVTSEMELFFDLCPCKTIGITGSDGKTTTSSLIAAILKQAGYTVHLGGNIGKALLPEVEQIQPDHIAVVELSSFQLLSMRESPDIAVITNLSPNHLDVHGTMEEYVSAKRNLLSHQNAFSSAILNADDAMTENLKPDVRGKLLTFSRKNQVFNGTFYDESDECLYQVNRGVRTLVCSRKDLRIPGVHNIENFLAAVAATFPFVPLSAIQKTAQTFTGVEHRIEYICKFGGVRWYNDSIATSPTRTIAGLSSFSQKLILIAGGYDKKLSYAPLAPKLVEKTKALILMGTTAPKIEQALQNCSEYRTGSPKLYHAEKMEDAVALAENISVSGDIVLLSPASASFDQYPNFEARGNHFKRLVNQRKEKANG